MADINQIISLGIGTPGDVRHFILFGLSPNPDLSTALPNVILIVSAAPRTVIVPPANRTVELRASPRSIHFTS